MDKEKRQARAVLDDYVDAHNLARKHGRIFRAAELLGKIHERLNMLMTLGIFLRVEYEKNNKYIRLKGGEE